MGAATVPRGASVGLGRRWLLGGAGAAVLAAFAVGVWSFAWPSVGARGEYAIGPAEAFAPGSVTTYLWVDGGLRELPLAGDYGARPGQYPADGSAVFHVVRLPDGSFRVLSGAAAHFDWAVVWFPLANPYDQGYRGLFGEPRGGALWAIDGTRVFGPAPRGLDSYAFDIRADGVLVVDLADLREGRRGDELPASYDVTSEDWATSGWPSR